MIDRGASVAAFVRDADPQSEFYRSGIFRQTTIVQGSLEDLIAIERAISEHEVDTVFHLGAQTIVGTALRSPLSTFESNIRGTYNLLEICRRHSDLVHRIVIASSDKAYGSSDILPYTEEMPLEGRYPYDVSKSCADLLSISYFHTYHLPIAITRCGNIFGGGDLNWSRLIPGTIRSFILGQQPEVRSDGKYTRDYLFVDDVVQAYLLLGENLYRPEIKGQAFNFSPNRPHTVMEVINAIQKAMHREDLSPVILNQAKAEIQNQSLACEKAQRLLAWEPIYSLEDGLLQTIEWYRNHLENKAVTVIHEC